MKELYMLCNAHLDPVWLWQRQEGVAEAISTFRVAAKFCEEYDGFVFNHNESVLYEWVEEHEPALFEKIKKLVKAGKWRIMGGWYLQPDCMMPSGESFVRQIEAGNRYFMEKFGVKPTTAINFDPFGHTRGLVQILAKSGYDSYIFMRPYDFVPERDFIWKGYDGSEITGHCTKGGYNTNKGKVKERIEYILDGAREGANLMLWGIGNHGGGPSKIDLDTIEEYKKEHPEIKMVHTWAENYFENIDKSKLRTVDTSLVHCMIGCYTSMVRIKKMHRLMENELGICEKMLAVSGAEYDGERLAEAEKALLFCEFHDILPGSMIKKAEDDALKLMDYGREIIARYCEKAFFKLCEGQKEGRQGEIPVLIFNPNPYWVEDIFEAEFQLEDQNWNDNEVTMITVRDEEGNYLPTQNEKETSSVGLDWRKKIAFKAKLKPMSINRFDCELKVISAPKRPIEACDETENHFVLKNSEMEVRINKKTGLLDCYRVNGNDYLKENGLKIKAYKDNEDPWGMTVDGYYDCIGEFEALSAGEANIFDGYPKQNLENVRVIENGAARAKIQAILKHNNSFAVITYTIPKHGSYVDIKVKMLANDVNIVYKLSFDTVFENGSFIGQAAFGREEMLKQEREVSYQKWCGLFDNKDGFAVLNNGTYGGSAKEGVLNITLMRTPVYSAHPINDRPITDPDRCYDHIDIGEREFEYRLTAGIENIDAKAEIFNQPVYALSFYPSGAGKKKDTAVELSNRDIILSGYKKDNGNIKVRMFNSADCESRNLLKIGDKSFETVFGAFEVKTYLFDGENLTECSLTGM